MKYQQKIYEHIWVEWFEHGKDRKTDRRTMEKNHNSDCTLIDSSISQVTIVFPEGDKIKKCKDGSGFRIQGVSASEFFGNPGKYYPLKAS